MIDFYEALTDISEIGFRMSKENVPLRGALNRILCEDVYSDIDMPPFDKSAMDGYACRKADLGGILRVIGTLHAGSSEHFEVGEGTCVKIMTGAPIPDGADTVVMIEHTAKEGETGIRCLNPSTKANICRTGEDIRKGEKVLSTGTLLRPEHIAVLASTGYASVKVSKKPRVALLSTGSELVEPDHKPDRAQIRNSNAYNLMAQLASIGIEAEYSGIVVDERRSIEEKLETLLEQNEVVILTGGVSMGEHDFVKKILQDRELNLLFEKVAIQPGKPVAFAAGSGKFCFGLSGNPVSSYLQFEILVKPLLYRMMWHDYEFPVLFVELAHRMYRKNASRLKFFPVRFNSKGQAEEIKFNGSAHIAGLTEAAGFGMFPRDCEGLDPGDKIEVLQIK